MKIGLMEVKQALKDHRFRDVLPFDMKEDIAKYLQNPGCPCNVPLYRRIIKEASDKLIEYYPNRKIDESDEMLNAVQNNWSVINCHVNELESRLKSLPIGRKQIAVTRYEDQVTVIINEVEF